MADNTRIYQRIFTAIGLTVLAILLLVTAMVTIALNSAYVQTRLVGWAGQILETRYGIHMEVEDISFKPFNRLTVNKLLVSSADVDSMIYISHGDLSFNANPFKLLRGEFQLSKVDGDSIKIRLLSNYTPKLEDTTSANFQIQFIPADLNLRHFDFALTDTVRNMKVQARSDGIQARVRASNLKDEFVVEDIFLDRPHVTIHGAQQDGGQNPYIRKLWEDFRAAHDIEPPDAASDSLFWALNFDIQALDVRDGKVEIYGFDTLAGQYKPPMVFSNIDGHILRANTEPNHIDIGPFEVGFILGDSSIVDRFSFDRLVMTRKEVDVKNLYLDYGDSEIAGQATLRYGSPAALTVFKDQVALDVRLSQSRIKLRDLMNWLPALEENSFFRDNASDIWDVGLAATGTLNNLKLSEWQVAQGGTYLRGSGSLGNLLSPSPLQLHGIVQSSRIPVRVIRQKFPRIEMPQGVDSLEVVRLYGSVNLRGQQWHVDSRINTELGIARVMADIDMHAKKYDGSIGLENFELGKFVQNPALGPLSIQVQLAEGTEFDLEALSGHLQTKVDSFYFKGFKYTDITLNGFFGNNVFLGHIAMNQPEIAFDLDTRLDFTRIFDIVAYGHIHRADLQALHFTDRKIELSSQLDIDMTMFPIDSLNGYARINDLKIIRDDTVNYSMNVITFDTRSWGDNYKDWRLVSDILSVDIDGQFNIENILGTTYEIVSSRHPRFVQYLPDWDLRPDSIYNNDFTMIINVDDTEEFANLINNQLDTIRDLNLSLTYRNRGADYFEYYFQASAPKLQFRDIDVESLNINASGSNTDNEWIVYLDSLNAGGVKVGNSQLHTTLVGDQLDFSIDTRTLNNILDDIHLAGSNRFDSGDEMVLTLDSSSFELLKSKWVLNQDNSIAFGKNKLFFNNFVYQSGERHLFIQSATDQSLIAGLRNMDIQFLNNLFPSGKFTFGGQASVILSVENLNDLTGLEVETLIDDLVINKQPFGRLNSLFYTLGSDELATVSMDVMKDGRESLRIEGKYDLFNKSQNKVPVFDFDLRATQFPILVLEFFMGSIISNTQGYVNAQIDVTSDGNQPDIGGRVLINGRTNIPILGTTYEFINSSVDIDNALIAFDEINMMDTEGNLASASGGIRHNHLSDFRMDTQVSTDKFLLLNTGKSAGMPFYGRGVGRANIEIKGPFNQLDMTVQAVTGPTSRVAIPISSTISVSDEEAFFIEFVSNNTFEEVLAEDPSFVQIEGLNLEVDLTLTPDCEVSIILDESTGDILRARGNSELLIELTRAGNFTIRGTYEVVSGEYQFAQLNFTRKMFRINQGGTISWTGDPYNAKIDIDASYSVRTPPYNFILEYIGQNDRLAELAQNATDVDLFLHLRGDLFAPEITFDMEFPELTGQVRNYVEDRLRVIADDQNEINKQVFGLLVARSFIPSVSSVVNIDGTVVNTVSEVITNQLSFFLTQYLQESIDEVPFISSVELNIGYNVYRNNYTAEAQLVVKTGNEFVVQPEIGFLDNRLQLTMEANLQTGSAVTSNTLITHDFVVEYSITEDNRLVAKLYQRTEPYVFEKTSKLGIGLTYQKEFDRFYEFLRGRTNELN